VDRFFQEAVRVLKEKGRIVMIEPANTPWAHFIYTRFHHENFDPNATWQVTGTRPLLDANDALAWIIFNRDREQFTRRFPELNIITLYHHTPIAYLLSGGFTIRQLMPASLFGLINGVETLCRFSNNITGMFQTIVLEKESHVPETT